MQANKALLQDRNGTGCILYEDTRLGWLSVLLLLRTLKYKRFEARGVNVL